MKLVKCINERTKYFGQITVGSRYYTDEKSICKGSDGDEYATFYTFHIPSEKYKLGKFKTTHFEIEHSCTQCIYASCPKDCKRICMVVAGNEKFV